MEEIERERRELEDLEAFAKAQSSVVNPVVASTTQPPSVVEPVPIFKSKEEIGPKIHKKKPALSLFSGLKVIKKDSPPPSSADKSEKKQKLQQALASEPALSFQKPSPLPTSSISAIAKNATKVVPSSPSSSDDEGKSESASSSGFCLVNYSNEDSD